MVRLVKMVTMVALVMGVGDGVVDDGDEVRLSGRWLYYSHPLGL
jgi:hypothetical protein